MRSGFDRCETARKFWALDASLKIYTIGILFSVNSVLNPWVVKSPLAFVFCAVGSVYIYAIGFLVWLIPKVKQAFSTPVNNYIFVAANFVVVFFAKVYSMNVVAYSIGLPPNDFEITLWFVTSILYVAFWLFFSSALAFIWKTAEIIYKKFFNMFNEPRGAKAIVVSSFINSCGHLCGALTVAFYLASFISGIYHKRELDDLIKIVAYYGDYQAIKNYPGIVNDDRINFHPNGVVSKANMEKDGIVIRIESFSK